MSNRIKVGTKVIGHEVESNQLESQNQSFIELNNKENKNQDHS